MSDPFQPLERELHITESIVDITNQYGISILFSTKSDTIYGMNANPNLHTFQFSVTNVDNRRDIEPNVPDIARRKDLFSYLKRNGFNVGIHIQPFIPSISTIDILKEFADADHVTIEGLKIVPQNDEQKAFVEHLLSNANLDVKSAFTQMGLLNLKPEIRYELYKPFIEYMESKGMSYSIADNDMRWIGNNNCCCGDKLVKHYTRFNVTTMQRLYGGHYTLNDVLHEIDNDKCSMCRCNDLFTSNRTEGCVYIREFYQRRFGRKESPFSPAFQYTHQPTLF